MVDQLLYDREESADISATGVIVTLDTQDRVFVAATLFHADANADYLVECSDTDSASNEDWHTLADNDATQSFRFEGRVPERFVRIRVDTAAAANDTADVAISASNGA